MKNSFLKSSNGTLAPLLSSETKEGCFRFITAGHHFIQACPLYGIYEMAAMKKPRLGGVFRVNWSGTGLSSGN